MRYIEKIYFCQNLENKKDKVLRDIQRNKYKSLYFVITIPPKYHQLEFFPIILGERHAFNIDEHILVGIAKNYDAGIELIYNISKDVYRQLGVLEYRRFFDY